MKAGITGKSPLDSTGNQNRKTEVVIIGGGFGGLYAAINLGDSPYKVTIIDSRNFHLFQPLLYQVASGALSGADICAPIRSVLKRYSNVTTIQERVTRIDVQEKTIITENLSFRYDILILAAGSTYSYYGHSEWAPFAPGLKTLEDAVEMRRRIFVAFEEAEKETDKIRQRQLLRFGIVGGGPTGVELAGAVAELAHRTLANDFRTFDPKQAEICIFEGSDRILGGYPSFLSRKAMTCLARLGVTVSLGARVERITHEGIYYTQNNEPNFFEARTVFWAAGVIASPLGKEVASQLEISLDKSQRFPVTSYLRLKEDPSIFVIGDLAKINTTDGAVIPGLASVAIQQGAYVADVLKRSIRNKDLLEFSYRDKGQLAVIGRNSAVASFGKRCLWGFPAWVVWALVHIYYLMEFDNKVIVFFHWMWSYFTKNQGARIIGERRVSSNDTIASSRDLQSQ